MATPQPLVSLPSDSSKFQLRKQSVGMDLFRNNGAAAGVSKSILNESLRRMVAVQRWRRETTNSWNSSANIHGTNLHDKGNFSEVDSLAPRDNSSTANEFNKTNVYILLAQQEAKCLQEFVSNI